MLELQGLCKDYKKLRVLDHIDLNIPEGLIFGLLGPNGAGKTTMLRIIMGLIRHTAGSIRLFGHADPTLKEVRRQLGYMPQQYAMYPGLTVAENIQFFGRLYKVDEPTLARRMEELLFLVELEDKRDVQVDTLSGGMVRRAMLASALIHHPRLLILDEPTTGVDPVLRMKFWNWFEELVEQGTSIIITTHHISEATHCKQVVFMRGGQILQQGQPQDLMAKYGVSDLEEAFVQATQLGREHKRGDVL